MGTVSRRPVTKAAHGLLRRCGVPCKPQCHTPGRPLHPSIRLWFASPPHSVCRHLCLCCCWCMRCCAMSGFLGCQKASAAWQHGRRCSRGTAWWRCRGNPRCWRRRGSGAPSPTGSMPASGTPAPGARPTLERRAAPALRRQPPQQLQGAWSAAQGLMMCCWTLRSMLSLLFVMGVRLALLLLHERQQPGDSVLSIQHPVSQGRAAGADAAAQAAAGGLCAQHNMCCFPGACGWR